MFPAFHIYALLRGIAFGFCMPLSIIFLNKHHCPLLHIGLLGSCFELVKFVTTIPIGRWTDCYSPKWPLILSGFIGGISWSIFFLGNHTLYIYYICTVLLGIAEACMSGSLESWITNCVDKAAITATILCNTSIMLLASITASLFSGWFDHNPLYCCLIISLPNFAKAIVATLSNSIKRGERPITAASFAFSTALFSGISHVYQSKKLRPILCSAFFVTMACDMVLRYYAPYLDQHGFKTTYTGYVTSGAGLIALLMLLLVTRYKKILSYHPLWVIVGIDMLGALICYLLISNIPPATILISLTMLLALEDIRSPIIKALIAEEIYDSHHKTLIFSLFVLVEAAGEILAGSLFGYVIDGYGLQIGFAVSMLLFVLSASFYIINRIW